jgi:hypothetical protein
MRREALGRDTVASFATERAVIGAQELGAWLADAT